jgi:hypothetical protein
MNHHSEQSPHHAAELFFGEQRRACAVQLEPRVHLRLEVGGAALHGHHEAAHLKEFVHVEGRAKRACARISHERSERACHIRVKHAWIRSVGKVRLKGAREVRDLGSC